MTQDVAGLQFQIDSSQADPANERLALMARHAASVESALGSMSRGASDSNAGFASFSAGAGRGIVQLAAFSSSLEGVVNQLQSARSALDGTVASFAAFETARQRADSLSTALGTSAVSLEAFTRQAAVFNMTSFETAGALQRITAAIEGQTAAGRQLRALMQDYGVTLSGITASNADQVLTRFVQQVRSVQSSPQNAQIIQNVLGTLDPGALASIQHPVLETVDAREQQLRVQNVNRTNAALVDNASQVIARSQLDIAQMTDYEGSRYDPLSSAAGAYDLSRLSPQQMQQLYNGMGRRADMNVPRDRLAMYHYLDTDAPDALRNTARQPPNWIEPSGMAPPWLNRAQYEMRGTWLDRFSHQFDDPTAPNASPYAGQYRARQTNIEGQYAEQVDRQGSMWGPGGFTGLFQDHGDQSAMGALANSAIARLTGNSLLNLYGIDATKPLVGDDRPGAAPIALNVRQGNANGLAQLGFGEPISRVAADIRLGALQNGSARGTPPDALTNLVNAYVNEGGLSRGEANIEATSRFNNAVDLQDVARDQAMSPGAAQLSQLGTERWIMAMPPEQRGRARALLGFAQQQGVSTTRWADRNMSVSDIVGSGLTVPGALSPNQSRGFDQLHSGQNDNEIAASNDATQTQLQLQRQLVMVIPEGSAAVQQQTAYWNAYNTAIAAGNDGDVARVKAQNAQREAIATTNTEMEKSLDLLKRRADADERSYAATSQAGNDPTARGVAGLNAGLANDVADLVSRGATPAQVTGYQTDRQRQFGVQAVQFGSDTEASSAQDLSVQQRLAAIAGTRLDTQRQLTHEIQTQRQFQPAINEAQASGDPDRIATVMQQMAAVVANLNAIDTANQRATNLNFASDTNFHADSDVQYSTLSPADQHYTSGYDDWYNRNKTHPEIAGKSGAEVMDLYLNPDKITDPALQADTAATRNRIVGADTRSNADATNQSNVALSRTQAAAAAAARGPYASSIASASVADPSNPQFGADYAGRQLAQTEASFSAQRAATDAAQAKQIQDYRDLSAALNESGAAYEKLKAQIDAVNQARELGPTDTDAQARDSITAAISKETVALGEQSLKLSENAELEKARSAAYSQGTLAGQAFDRHAATFTQSQQLDKQAATFPDDPNIQAAVASQRAALAKGSANSDQTAYGQAASQFSRESAARADDNTMMQADISAGPFATPQSVNNATNNVLAQRASDASGGLTSYQSALDSLSQNDALKQQLDDVHALRDGMNQLGEAAAASFESSIVHANTYRKSIISLGESVETSLIHTFVSRPLEKGLNTLMDSGLNALGGALGFGPSSNSNSNSNSGSTDGSGSGTSGGGGSGILGGIGNFISNGILGQATKGMWSGLGDMLGLGGSAVAAVPAGFYGGESWDVGSGIGDAFGFATGGIIDRGIPSRYLASGGLIDRPTTFYAAGGKVMAGESDTEAIMPLKRLPNGNLGIAATGGAAGPTIIVQAPVTIQGGGGGQGGTMSAAQQKKLQQQMVQVHTAAVRSVMVNEMRNGGDLAQNIGNN